MKKSRQLRSLTSLVTAFAFICTMMPAMAFADAPSAPEPTKAEVAPPAVDPAPAVRVDAPVDVNVTVRPVVKPTIMVNPTPVEVNLPELNPTFAPNILPAPVVIQPAPRYEIEKQWWFWTAVVVVVGGVTVAGVCGGGYCGGGHTDVSFR